MELPNTGEITSPKDTLTAVEENNEAANLAIPAKEEAPSKDCPEDEPTEKQDEKPSDAHGNNEPVQPGVDETAVKQSEDCKLADFATDTLEKDTDDPLYKTPFIPDRIFTTLPALLKDSCESFDNKRERDVYLISALTVLSGCFETVSGEYSQRTVYPNLYSFIVAPAASGKGVMVFGKQLGSNIHSSLIEESKKQRTKYDLEVKAYNGLMKKSKKEEIDLSTLTPPIEPPFKVLFIPGDVSSSRVIDHLVANGGTGTFCETEADTMAGSFNQDWGSFSDKLRKAFQHEPISYSRKGSSEFKEVDCPRLSVLLTGTPSQVGGIIKGVADGLFSRFCFYTFKGTTEWKPAFPKNKGNLTDYFDGLAEKVAGYSMVMNQSEIKFRLTAEQEAMLDKVCSQWLIEGAILIGEEAKASVMRLGLILYRIAMTLSILKRAESQSTGTDMLCEDTEFNTAMALSQVFKEHAYLMLKQIPKQADKKTTKRMKFLQALPNSATFKSSEAVEVGKALELSARTVATYLKDLLAGQLIEYATAKDGLYQKVNLQTLPSLQTK